MSTRRLSPVPVVAITVVALLVLAVPARAGQRPDLPPAEAPAALLPDTVETTTPAQEAVAPRAPTHETYTLQVIILRARDGEPSLPDLPEDALAALRDLQGLTRFRHFEVVDTGWIRTREAGQARLGEAGAFEVYAALGSREADPSRSASGSGGSGQVVVRHFELGYWPWEKDEESGRIYHAEEPTRLLSSTFALEVGETVVVGTSRLTDGDEALVVLVKAME